MLRVDSTLSNSRILDYSHSHRLSVTAVGLTCRFLGKTAVSILSESLQLPPENEFVTEK